MATDIKQPNVLLVEGKDEENFFTALIEKINLTDIQILNLAGKTKLKINLETLKLSPNFSNITCIGIVRDADNDPHAAFQSVCYALRAADLPVPSQPYLLTKGVPNVKIAILPNENQQGMLEDLCLESVASDPALECIDLFFDCLKQKPLDFPKNLSKARTQAFLASRKVSGIELGVAAQRGYWPFDSEVFKQLSSFLNDR